MKKKKQLEIYFTINFFENNVHFTCKHINQKRNIQILSHFSHLILLSFEENGLRIKSMTADLLNKAAISGFRS